MKERRCKQRNIIESTLREHMRHLHQEIENLVGLGVLAIGMLQSITSVLLHVEAFVLNFPSNPPS
jgi:hypothetical protein